MIAITGVKDKTFAYKERGGAADLNPTLCVDDCLADRGSVYPVFPRIISLQG